MKEKKNFMYDKYISIEFANHVFYLPRIPANINIKNNTLSIDMANMEEYVLVDGVRCYYCLEYNSDNGIIDTWLKDFTIDGLLNNQEYYFSFILTDKEFPFRKGESRVVVPKRDYSELTSVFLDEYKDLDERIVKFLENHPEMFEKAPIYDWLDLNISISKEYFDTDLIPESIPDLFLKYLTKDYNSKQ